MKNIGFTGVFRIVFKPLAEEFPCFGAVSYSLREKVSFMMLLFKIISQHFGREKICSEGNADYDT